MRTNSISLNHPVIFRLFFSPVLYYFFTQRNREMNEQSKTNPFFSTTDFFPISFFRLQVEK